MPRPQARFLSPEVECLLEGRWEVGGGLWPGCPWYLRPYQESQGQSFLQKEPGMGGDLRITQRQGKRKTNKDTEGEIKIIKQ